MDTGLLEVHDRLLAEKPEGAEHNTETDPCPLCALQETENDDTPAPGGKSMTTTETEPRTFTEAEVKAKIEEAVTTATSAMQQSLEAADVEAKVDELTEQLTELQAKYDSEVAARAAADEKVVDVQKAWDDEKAAAELAVEAAARKDTRLAELAEIIELPEDYLKENEDRFAAMTDEDWALKLKDFKVSAGKTDTEIPSTSVFTAGRESDPKTRAGSMLSELPSLRRTLTDPRTL